MSASNPPKPKTPAPEQRPEQLRESLRQNLDETTWSLLRSHAARDGMILVAQKIELLEAAVAVAANDQAQVAAWIDRGELGKPSAAQLQAWEKQLQKKFLCVVVQPYVLAQEVLEASSQLH